MQYNSNLTKVALVFIPNKIGYQFDINLLCIYIQVNVNG